MEWIAQSEWVYQLVLGVALVYALSIAAVLAAAALLLFIASVHNAVILYSDWYRRIAGTRRPES